MEQAKTLNHDERLELIAAPFPIINTIRPQKSHGSYGAYKGRTPSELSHIGGSSVNPVVLKGSKLFNG